VARILKAKESKNIVQEIAPEGRIKEYQQTGHPKRDVRHVENGNRQPKNIITIINKGSTG